ncbi:RNA-binding S4 domain-containing protein [Salinisphaera sp. PC39]|uniref:RNA-binding S4 domain-containing protein n=1 Tax=Salinisphaera sp. PC39 TaxID=1304156 RepID=UPI00333E5726
MTDDSGRVRLDKWLWAARFFKTRPLAAEAVAGGKVDVAGVRARPGYAVKVGDRLEITKGELRFEVVVADVAARRGPAAEAQRLYEETAASVAARERAAERRRVAGSGAPRPEGRPDKKSRRRLQRVKRGG